MTITPNLRGTSEEHFRIGLAGATVYSGVDDPNLTAVTPIDSLKEGDMYLRQSAARAAPWVYENGVWTELQVYDTISRTILFSDAPDSGVATYDIGIIEIGYSVSGIHIEVTTVFDDATVDEISINRPAAPATVLMATTQSDIKITGSYLEDYPPAGTPVDGAITADFNADPDGAGGTTGQLTVTVFLKKL